MPSAIEMREIRVLVILLACSLSSALNQQWSCSCQGGGSAPMWMGGDTAAPENQQLRPYQGPPGKIGPRGMSGPVGPKGAIGPPGAPGITEFPTPSELWNVGSWLNPGFSCDDLKQRGGINQTGVYMIKLDAVPTPIPVYCDMESTDGGWTLIARIHENDIDGKCTFGDIWSSEKATGVQASQGSSWENTNSFGLPYTPTSSDYKSPAYFALNASDVMIWHVSNDVDYLDISNQSTFKYYTNNSFLNQHGGSLRSLFKNHYPLKALPPFKRLNAVDDLIALIHTKSWLVRSKVSSYYSYTYDKTDEIGDGGKDMFDGGNRIYYTIGTGGETKVDAYNKTFALPSSVAITTKTSQPFHALMWIGNEDGATRTFQFSVRSGTGADNAGYTSFTTGSLSKGSLRMKYYVFQVYEANDPSICKLIYYVTDEKECGVQHSEPVHERTTEGTDPMNIRITFSDTPKYTLIGSTHQLVSTDEVKDVLDVILDSFLVYSSSTESGCTTGLSVPVNYIQGNNSTMLSSVPPQVRHLTTPGFLYFSGLSAEGDPYAMCPGVRPNDPRRTNVKNICIGGISSRDTSSCGDFAGWGGKTGDSPSAASPSGYAKSLNDLASSILIFVK